MDQIASPEEVGRAQGRGHTLRWARTFFMISGGLTFGQIAADWMTDTLAWTTVIEGTLLGASVYAVSSITFHLHQENQLMRLLGALQIMEKALTNISDDTPPLAP